MASVDEKQGHGRVLEFDKVTKSFAKTDSNEITHALAEVNLTIQPGEFVSIVGTSGCGKSTILRLIAGLIRPTTGEIRLGGKPIVGAGPDRGMVFQKATLFPWLTVEKNVSFSLRMQKKQDKELVEHMLKMVGLEDFRKDYPHQLSGGMAQRVALVRSLINHPDILLLDEPTRGIDVGAKYEIYQLIIDLAKEGKGVIMVSSEMPELLGICDRILVMYLGRIVEIAECEELYNNTLHPYTKVLLGAVPVADPKVEKTRERVEIRGEVPSLTNRPAGCPFSDRCSYATERCKKEVPTLKDIGNGHEVACFLYE